MPAATAALMPDGAAGTGDGDTKYTVAVATDELVVSAPSTLARLLSVLTAAATLASNAAARTPGAMSMLAFSASLASFEALMIRY